MQTNPNLFFEKSDWDLNPLIKAFNTPAFLRNNYRIFGMEFQDNPKWGIKYNMDVCEFNETQEKIKNALVRFDLNTDDSKIISNKYENDESIGLLFEHHEHDFFNIWIREDNKTDLTKSVKVLSSMIGCLETIIKQ